MPPAQSPSPSPTPTPQPSQDWPQTSPTQTPPPAQKRSRMGLIIGAIVVLIIIIGGIVFAMSQKNGGGLSSGGGNQSAETAQLAKLSSAGSSVSNSNLASFNKTDLFYAIYRKAAEQPRITTTENYYRTTNFNDPPSPQKTGIHQTGFDYTTKQLTYQDSTVYSGTGDQEFNRCVNGNEYFYSTLFPEDGWKQATGPAASDDCIPATNIYVNDGLNTGGLNASQAQKFVDALRSYPGLITVNKLSIYPYQGKDYLRFDVTVHRINNGSYKGGTLFFDKAFGVLGLDNSKWVYANGAAALSGAYLSYVVDPSTQLPAFTQVSYTPLSQGSPWDNMQIMYSFGALPTTDLSTSNIQPLQLPWPVLILQQQ